jgi:hypothetical protein
MAFYTGEAGCIELKRTGGRGQSPCPNAPAGIYLNSVNVTLDDGDVNVEKRRFNVNEDVEGVFISGDQIEIETVDGSNLILVDGHNYNDWRGFLNVDMLGGFRLYKTFEDAISGEVSKALELVATTKTQHLRMSTRSDSFTPLANVTSFEFTTDRQTIDTTTLGSEFVQQYEAGLISGQGVINCIWEDNANICSQTGKPMAGGREFPYYLAQLCMRLKEGADFFGRFFIYKNDGLEAPVATSVWYEAECIVTQVTTSVEPSQVINSTINFVTTGKFRLMSGVPPYYLLQEDGFSYILLEENQGFGKILINAPD